MENEVELAGRGIFVNAVVVDVVRVAVPMAEDVLEYQISEICIYIDGSLCALKSGGFIRIC
jgi:hypothetical protein